jgi:hypothetical protein
VSVHEHALLLARARHAYERGRVWHGMWTSGAVLPMAALSWYACGNPGATAMGATTLVALVAAAVWRGQEAGRGARLGLLAGGPALLSCAQVASAGHLCTANVCLLFPVACLLGGVVAGILVGVLAVRRGLPPLGFFTAVLTAWLAASLGCVMAGPTGIAVLVLGMGFGLTPTLVWRRA